MYDVRLRLCVPTTWRPQVETALAGAAITVDPDAAVGLAVTPHRVVDDELGRWTAESTPHLLIGVWSHGVEIGPWVQPGQGPCAHCVAAATLDADHDDPDGLPVAPVGLLAVAAGWAAREVSAWLRGDTPTTWGTRWWLGADPVPQPRRTERHPYCGCAWWDGAWWDGGWRDDGWWDEGSAAG